MLEEEIFHFIKQRARAHTQAHTQWARLPATSWQFAWRQVGAWSREAHETMVWPSCCCWRKVDRADPARKRLLCVRLAALAAPTALTVGARQSGSLSACRLGPMTRE